MSMILLLWIGVLVVTTPCDGKVNGRPARTMQFKVESFMQSCVQAYKDLCGELVMKLLVFGMECPALCPLFFGFPAFRLHLRLLLLKQCKGRFPLLRGFLHRKAFNGDCQGIQSLKCFILLILGQICWTGGGGPTHFQAG